MSWFNLVATCPTAPLSCPCCRNIVPDFVMVVDKDRMNNKFVGALISNSMDLTLTHVPLLVDEVSWLLDTETIVTILYNKWYNNSGIFVEYLIHSTLDVFKRDS